MYYKDQKFVGEVHRLDGNTYENCLIRQCEVHYGGGALPKFEGLTVLDCQTMLDGAAMDSIKFLRFWWDQGDGGKSDALTVIGFIIGRELTENERRSLVGAGTSK